jgi:hypothetical protein
MRAYRRIAEQAKPKAEPRVRVVSGSELPMEELVNRAREDLEGLATQIGLTIIRQVMEAEIQAKVGRWGPATGPAPWAAARLCGLWRPQGETATAALAQSRG